MEVVPLAYIEIFVDDSDDTLLSSELCKFELLELAAQSRNDTRASSLVIKWIQPLQDHSLLFGELVFGDGWKGFTSQNPVITKPVSSCFCRGYLCFPPKWRARSGIPACVVDSTLVRVVVSSSSSSSVSKSLSIHQHVQGTHPEPSLSRELYESIPHTRISELRERLQRSTGSVVVGTTRDAESFLHKAKSRTLALQSVCDAYFGTSSATKRVQEQPRTMRRGRHPPPFVVHPSITNVMLQAASPSDRFYVISPCLWEGIELAVHSAIVESAVRNESVTIVLDEHHHRTMVDPFAFPQQYLYYNHGSGGVVVSTNVCLVVRSRKDPNAFQFPLQPKPAVPSSSLGTSLTDVGGNSKAKHALQDALSNHPKLTEWGWLPPTGILLYGPPGVGKTMLVRSQLKEMATVVYLKSTDVAHAIVGAGEKSVIEAFAKAKANPPAVIFIDEFQSLFTQRSKLGSSRVTTTLLQCMDGLVRWKRAGQDSSSSSNGVSNFVLVVAATNTPWMVDDAFLRPGRFDRSVYVELPNTSERKEILTIHLTRMKTNLAGKLDDIAALLAKRTEMYSGADLVALCRYGAVHCLVAGRQWPVEQDFLEALERGKVEPSSDKDLLNKIESWRKTPHHRNKRVTRLPAV